VIRTRIRAHHRPKVVISVDVRFVCRLVADQDYKVPDNVEWVVWLHDDTQADAAFVVEHGQDLKQTGELGDVDRISDRLQLDRFDLFGGELHDVARCGNAVSPAASLRL